MNPDSPTPQSKEATAFEKFMGSRPIDVSGRNPGELQYDFLGLMWDRDKRIFLAGQESMKATALTPEEAEDLIKTAIGGDLYAWHRAQARWYPEMGDNAYTPIYMVIAHILRKLARLSVPKGE